MLQRELEVMQKENELLDQRYHQEKEIEERLNVEKRHKENIIKDVNLQERLRVEEEEGQLKAGIERRKREQEEQKVLELCQLVMVDCCQAGRGWLMGKERVTETD